jgi:hypothetical protein
MLGLSTKEARPMLSPNQAFFFAGLILFGLSAASDDIAA